MATSIVVADDNSAVRSLLVRLVQRADPEVDVIDVASGQAALDMCQRHQPGIVLLDLGLPDIDGLSVLHRLKEQPQTPYIIIVTGDPAAQQDALAHGADEVWIKPMDVREMLCHLTHVLVAHHK